MILGCLQAKLILQIDLDTLQTFSIFERFLALFGPFFLYFWREKLLSHF
jgi:hypothetical protein